MDNRAGKRTQERRFDGNQRKIEKSENTKHETKRPDLFCNHCKRSGYTEERCYSKQQDARMKQDFHQGQQKDRPPPVRALEEETEKGYEPYISEEAQEELNDPFSYEQQEETNKSYMLDQSE